MITIYQIRLTDEDIIRINAGHNVPAFTVRNRMMLGFDKSRFCEDYIQYYTPVYQVDTDNLDYAYEATNLWEGYDVRRLARGSSSSVGDIFVRDGVCYIVDNFGFVEVGYYEGMK